MYVYIYIYIEREREIHMLPNFLSGRGGAFFKQNLVALSQRGGSGQKIT